MFHILSCKYDAYKAVSMTHMYPDCVARVEGSRSIKKNKEPNTGPDLVSLIIIDKKKIIAYLKASASD